MTKAARTVSYGVAAAAALFAVCILIRPQGLGADNGLSYYGDFKTTIIPYSLAFFAAAYSYLEAARYVKDGRGFAGNLALALRAMAALMVGLLVTPSSLVNPIHTFMGTTLFSLQLAVSMWLLLKFFKDWQTTLLVAMMWLSGLAALYYLPRSQGLLLQTQVVFQLAFGLLLIRTLDKLPA